MKKDLLRKVSGLFMWGFEGPRVSSEVHFLLKHYPPAGIILFKTNLENPKQIRSLTVRLQQLSQSPLLIGTDQEGGRVARLPEPFVKYPPPATLGDWYHKDGHERFLTALGRFMGKDLMSVGINTNFAPVLDVNSNPKNPIIGDRSFSNDPKEVAKCAVAFYRGLQSAGVIACGKHFPGHGDTGTDSHLTLPIVRRKKSSLEKVELPPFREAIQKNIPLLMTAHVIYEAWDRTSPATLSRIILHDLLRKRMGFKGVVISDDLQMKAISERYSESESSLLALEAGVDLLLICKKGEQGAAIVERVARGISRSPFLLKRVQESLGRLRRLKKKFLK